MLTAQEMVNKYTIGKTRQLNKICSPLFESFGVNFLYYNQVNPEGRLFSIGTHPGWMETYFSWENWINNPFFSSPENFSNGVFLYSKNAPKNLTETQELANTRFSLQLTAVFIYKRNKNCIQFGMSLHDLRYQDKILNELKVIEKFFEYFQNSLEPLLNQAKEASIDLIAAQDSQFFQKNQIKNLRLEREDKIRFLSKITPHDSRYFKQALTQREKQCAKLIHKGLTAREIGDTLQISPRTAESYIDHIRQKLAPHSRSDLIRTIHELDTLGFLE